MNAQFYVTIIPMTFHLTVSLKIKPFNIWRDDQILIHSSSKTCDKNELYLKLI
jgi:hypothetical protein